MKIFHDKWGKSEIHTSDIWTFVIGTDFGEETVGLGRGGVAVLLPKESISHEPEIHLI